MKSHYFLDLKKRLYLKKKEIIKLVYLYLIYSKEISNLNRYKLYLYFFFSRKLKKNFEITNHCILTKNNKAVNRFTGLTRSNLKYLINWGYLNGIRK